MATLVRPDGFIAARLESESPEEARQELVRAMRSILGFADVEALTGAEAAAV